MNSVQGAVRRDDRFEDLFAGLAGRPDHPLPWHEPLEAGRSISMLLGDAERGTRLLEGMLAPRAESLELLRIFQTTGAVDLGAARVERRNGLGLVELRRGAQLNAENESSNEALEAAVDLVLLDEGCSAGVLRGAPVEHPRYVGRRVFNSGLDLSELYRGELTLRFFVLRELGFVAKLQRGLVDPLRGPVEKPWLAAVETYSIGGGTQLLLVMDRVVGERDALLSLPAGREGIVPGAAALRLPAVLGLSEARRLIASDRRFRADSDTGRRLVDDLVDTEQMDDAIDRAADEMLAPGLVSVVANRRALRAAQEPLDAFRAYMATYAIEQARCLASEALAANLERNWIDRSREP